VTEKNWEPCNIRSETGLLLANHSQRIKHSTFNELAISNIAILSNRSAA